MQSWMHKAEKIIDDLMPTLLVTFLLIVAAEVFLGQDIEPFKSHIDIFDTVLISVFAADLFFKYHRAKSLPSFLKKYWLQIIAVVPFYFVFRVMEYMQLSEFAAKGTRFANETRTLGRGPALIIREAETTEGISRTAKLLRFKPLLRLPRLLFAVPFFEKPTGRHHPHERKTKISQKTLNHHIKPVKKHGPVA
ncbi:hypothetical protein HY640_02300 [Candidatus Woesearchaeota archaeon]|nr:hypothetical protein [Candidatus Woesearchaeota archaeon]